MIIEQMTETEKQIIDAARSVFHRSGFDGARMQEIADEAGINKAMLHYYFRNKDKLFEAVFREAFFKNMAPIMQILVSSDSIEKKVPLLVDQYLDTMLANPHVPAFVLHELNRNPGRLIALVSNSNLLRTSKFVRQLEEGMQRGEYRTADPRQLLMHLLSMIVFPFIARPMLSIAFEMDDASFRLFIEQRRIEIPNAFFRMINNQEVI